MIGFISFYTLKDIELSNQKQTLTYLINSIELNNSIQKDLNSYAKDLKKVLDVRVTFVDMQGNVLGDSDHTVYDMDNHLHRDEMQSALKTEFGISVRHSDTINKEFLYVAKVISFDDREIFLRVSKPLEYINNSVYKFWSKLILLLALAIIIISLINFFANQRIDIQVLHLINHLQNISDKRYNYNYEKSWISEFSFISYEVDHLAHKLQKREKSNREINAKLKLKNRQLQDMISAISHEFKNPIAIILGYARTILDATLNEEQKKQFLEKIHNNTLKLNQMIDRMTLFTKLENNETKLTKEQDSLEMLTKEICDNFQIKNPNIKINFSAQNNTNIKFDKMLIELAITNLIDNAIKYSQNDIDVSVIDNEIKVKDYGLGIKKSDMKKIKKKFYRVDKNSWNNSMGLGLALVDYIINLHESKLIIESEYEVGSTFSFKLV